jgi:hypothetical protein
VDVPLATSTALATRDELFSPSEQPALTGFLAGYRGLTRAAYTLGLRQYVAWCTEHRVPLFGARCSVPVAPTSSVSPSPRIPGPGAGHDRSPAVHGRLFLSLRRTGGPDRGVAGRACAPPPPGLPVPRHRPGPQRGRRHAGGRRSGGCSGSRPGQRARPQRAPSVRSHRREQRGPRVGAGPPHAQDPAQSRQVVTTPLAPPTARAIDLAVAERCEGPSSSAPLVNGSIVTPPAGSCAASPDRDRQTRRTPHLASRVHHRRA